MLILTVLLRIQSTAISNENTKQITNLWKVGKKWSHERQDKHNKYRYDHTAKLKKNVPVIYGLKLTSVTFLWRL